MQKAQNEEGGFSHTLRMGRAGAEHETHGLFYALHVILLGSLNQPAVLNFLRKILSQPQLPPLKLTWTCKSSSSAIQSYMLILASWLKTHDL